MSGVLTVAKKDWCIAGMMHCVIDLVAGALLLWSCWCRLRLRVRKSLSRLRDTSKLKLVFNLISLCANIRVIATVLILCRMPPSMQTFPPATIIAPTAGDYLTTLAAGGKGGGDA